MRQPRFGFKPNDIVEISVIPPKKGQFVMVQLRRNCFEIAKYMVRYVELDNSLPILGAMDRIIGVVVKV